MSYPIDLDEYTETKLLAELARRQKARREGLCDYCGRYPSTQPCKFAARHSAVAGMGDGDRLQALHEQEGFLPGDLIEWSDGNVKGMRGRVLRVVDILLVEDTDAPGARFWLDLRDWPDTLQTRLLSGAHTPDEQQSRSTESR